MPIKMRVILKDHNLCAQCGLRWDLHPYDEEMEERVCRLMVPIPVGTLEACG